jgi:hypothetical protein
MAAVAELFPAVVPALGCVVTWCKMFGVRRAVLLIVVSGTLL